MDQVEFAERREQCAGAEVQRPYPSTAPHGAEVDRGELDLHLSVVPRAGVGTAVLELELGAEVQAVANVGEDERNEAVLRETGAPGVVVTGEFEVHIAADGGSPAAHGTAEQKRPRRNAGD